MMNSDKSLGEQNYEQFAERYAAMVETKPHIVTKRFIQCYILFAQLR